MEDRKYSILNEFEHNTMLLQDLLGNGPTDNEQLLEIGTYLFDDDFIGVYTADNFPKDINNDNMFIMNTLASNEKKNGHWCAFAISKDDGKLYCYDTFSRDPNKLSEYWKNIKMINANTSGRDQSFNSSDCGPISMSWLISFYKWGDRVINVI